MATSVLIVEDDATARAGLEYVLRKKGFTPVAVGSVRQAIASLDNQRAVLLDLMLPDGDGADLLLHMHNTGCTIPVAVMTGKCLPDNSEKMEGVDQLFQKPITQAKLDAMLNWLAKL